MSHESYVVRFYPVASEKSIDRHKLYTTTTCIYVSTRIFIQTRWPIFPSVFWAITMRRCTYINAGTNVQKRDTVRYWIMPVIIMSLHVSVNRYLVAVTRHVQQTSIDTECFSRRGDRLGTTKRNFSIVYTFPSRHEPSAVNCVIHTVIWSILQTPLRIFKWHTGSTSGVVRFSTEAWSQGIAPCCSNYGLVFKRPIREKMQLKRLLFRTLNYFYFFHGLML